MIPKINFINSDIYNREIAWLSNALLSQKHVKKIEKSQKYLSDEWDKMGQIILKDIAQVTGLKWHQKEINCYLTFLKSSFSDPLTIGIAEKQPIDIFDAVVHELIHRILSEKENWPKIKKGWQKLMNEYKDKKQLTKTHIVIHAIHAIILEKRFGTKRMIHQSKFIKSPEYIESWKIVFDKEAKKIVDKLKQRT